MKKRHLIEKASPSSIIEALEPRLLYSATIDVVLVDSALEDQEMLSAATRDSDHVYFFDSTKESVADIVNMVSQWSLENQMPIDSLSIISHGTSGSFELGSDTVTTSSIGAQGDIWEQLGDALADDANIYLYGCEVGADSKGQALLDQLANATEADVFASDDVTGAKGDWELEVASQGDEEELKEGLVVPVNAALLKNYSGTLTSTGYQNPTASTGNWDGELSNGSTTTDSSRAYADDGVRIAPGDQNTEQFYNYGLGVPTGAAVNGIEVAIDAFKPDRYLGIDPYDPSGLVVSLSWDGGTSWTATKEIIWNRNTDLTNVYGSTNDTWGRTWTADELSDTNFRVKVYHNSNPGFGQTDGIEVDWVGVRVDYNEQPTTSGLADQNLQEDFTDYTIDLNTIFADLETSDANLVYSVAGNTNIGVSIDASGIATISNSTANWNGTETITFTAQDEAGLTVDAAADFIVAPVNDAPVLTGDLTATVNEGATYTLQASDLGYTDIDDNDAGVTFTISNESNGRIQVGGVDASSFTGTQLAAGQVTFIHDGSETTAAAFDVNVDDGNEDSSAPVNSTFNFTVTPLNDAPVADNDTLLDGLEDTTSAVLNTGMLTGDTDAEGDTLTITHINGTVLVGGVQSIAVTNGTVNIAANDDITFTPDADYVGAVSFDYTINDGNGGTDTATVSGTITNVNDAPVADNDTLLDGLEEATSAVLNTNMLAGDTDVDGDTLTITHINGTLLTGGVQSIAVSNGTVNVAANNDITFTPDIDYVGAVSFDYTISDGNGGTDTAAINGTITNVNDAPVADNDTLLDGLEEATSAVLNTDMLTGDTDVEGDTLTITHINGTLLTGGVQSIAVTNGTVNIAANDDITFTPDADYVGAVSFDYTISDGNGGTDTATVSGTITNINDAPVLVGDLTATLNEGATYTLQPSDLGYTDVDDNDAGVTFFISNESNGRIQVGGLDASSFTGTQLTAGQVTFIHDGSETTTAAFDVNVEDGNEDSSAPVNSTFNITVTPLNDAPVADNDTLLDGLEDTTSAVLNTGMLTGDTDAEGDTLTITHINGTPLVGGVQSIAVANGTVNIVANDDITFTSDANYVGAVSFDYTISDGNGGTDTATVSGTITSVNDAPVADNDTLLDGLEETTSAVLNTNMLAGDTDVDGDTLAITHINGTLLTGGVQSIAVTNGTVNVAANNDITFTPDTDYVGAVSFDYTISDGNGGTDTATVSGTITNVNDAPVADNDTLLDGLEETTSAVLNINMLAGDTDVDGDTLTITHINGTLLTGGVQSIAVTNGTVNVAANNDITFTPDVDYVGAVSFDYTISDGNGGTDTATVSGTITNVNDAPVADNDTLLDGLEETTSAVLNTNMLAGDTDVDGDTLTITHINGTLLTGGVQSITVTNGTVNVAANNDITFTPDTNYVGAVSFDYSISDGNGGTDTATVSGTMTNVNDAPVADNDTLLDGLEETTSAVLNTNMLAGDTDVDGDTLTITHINGTLLTGGVQSIAVTNGTVNVAANNDITFTPDTDFVGAVSFDYTISDGSGGTDTATVSGTITNVNDAPVADNDTLLDGLEEATSAVLNNNMLAGDTDVDGDILTITHINGTLLTGGAQSIAVTNGTVNVAANNDITFTPDVDYVGAVSFDYTISDGNGGTDTATVSGTITNVNDAPVADNDTLLDGLEETTSAVLNTNMLAGDTDVDGDTLTITHINGTLLTGGVQSIAVTNGIVNVAANNDITFTPDTNYVGAVSFDYSISDGNGGTDTATVSGTITNVNDAPVADNDTLLDGLEETTSAVLNTNMLAGDTDVDGDTLTITHINGTLLTGGAQSIAVTNGTVNIAANNDITFTPDADYVGVVSFDYTISDGNGGTDTATVSGTISNLNDAPVLTGDLTASINEGGTYTLQSTDLGYSDVDDNDTGVTFTISNESNGRIQVNGIDANTFTGEQLAAGQVMFIHDGSETTTAAFDVNVDDGNEDGSTPLNSTFNFSVNPINDAPTSTGLDNQNLFQGFDDYTIDLTTIFSDAETASNQLVFSVQGNSNIDVVIDDQGIATISSTSWNGTERITFIAEDENGLSITASADFIVSPIGIDPTENSESEIPSQTESATSTEDSSLAGTELEEDQSLPSTSQDNSDQIINTNNNEEKNNDEEMSLSLSDFLESPTRVVDGIVSLREVNDTYDYSDNPPASGIPESLSGIEWLKSQVGTPEKEDFTITTSFEDSEFYKRNEWLWDEDNEFGREMRKDQETEGAISKIAKTTGGLLLTFSGLWLGRAAAFGSSLFTLIPAWRSLDPIAVLNKKKKSKSKKNTDKDIDDENMNGQEIENDDNCDAERIFSNKPRNK